MTTGKYVSYARVSTERQGRSGLGLEAQQFAVAAYLNSVQGTLVGQFTEIETGKGTNALERRPQLREALSLCKKIGATLLIAKLDRLARNIHFVSGLIESGTEFVAADMPTASKTMIQIYAVMAEHERDQISARTCAAPCSRQSAWRASGHGWHPEFECQYQSPPRCRERLCIEPQGFDGRLCFTQISAADNGHRIE